MRPCDPNIFSLLPLEAEAMVPPAAEANPLTNLKQELSLNHSMAMDQLGRLSREVKKLKPSLEELQVTLGRALDRQKDELSDEMVGLSGRVGEMERTLKEDLDRLGSQLQQRVLSTLQEQVQAQQAALDRLSHQLEELSRTTLANLSQLRLALTMAEVEAQVVARHPQARTPGSTNGVDETTGRTPHTGPAATGQPRPSRRNPDQDRSSSARKEG